MTHVQLAPGTRIRFADERCAYTVRAVSANGRWVICTKPFAARNTVLYTVIDFANDVRGRDNFSGLGYETDADCLAAAQRFNEGTARHSRRTPPIPLRITWIRAPHEHALATGVRR